MYSGKKTIDYLSSEISKGDTGESSHWKKYHSNFKFDGCAFKGLQGFGGNSKPYRGVRKIFHNLAQSRFRKMGRNYKQFSKLDRLAQDIANKQGRAYDLDMLRQSITLSFLIDSLPKSDFQKNSTICVIGDGFASMTTLILASNISGRVILINLSKTLLVDLWYLRLWMGEEKFETSVHLVTDVDNLTSLFDNKFDKEPNIGSVIAIQAENHELLRQCPIDLSINIVSMQEMNPDVINAYFDDLHAVASKRKSHFYCCNREEKEFPDGTITRFKDYRWNKGDIVISDGLCPWHQHFYSLRPPFYRSYDGPIQHRLVKFAQEDK